MRLESCRLFCLYQTLFFIQKHCSSIKFKTSNTTILEIANYRNNTKTFKESVNYERIK